MSDPLISQTTNGTRDAEIEVECVNCKVTTIHRVLTSVETIHSIADDMSRVANDHQIIQCQGCRNISFRNRWVIAEPDHHDPTMEHEDLFPPRPNKKHRKRMQDVQGLPKAVLPIYWEVLKAINGSQPILAGIGIRALVETVCRQKRAAGRTLEKRIDSLAAKGLLSTNEAKILHKLRHLGNRAAHAAAAPTPPTLTAALDVAEHLLQTVYVVPTVGRGLKRRN